MKKYKIIYADPPWSYSGTLPQRAKVKHYEVMDTQKICDLPINSLSDDNCALFLWTSYYHLPDALRVIESWGFRYVTCAFCWIKLDKGGKAILGMGQWTRSNSEICLFARKGDINRISNDVSQIIMSRRREHSRKPDEVRNKIVDLMGDIPRIELFARQRFQGWDVWGNEAPTKELQMTL